jgi:hypothetical protein
MDDPVLRAQTADEYFKDLVEAALTRQHVRASDVTSYYVVNLLCRFVRPHARIAYADDGPLALQLKRALESAGIERRERLRNLGDFSLFTSGFFSDSLHRRVTDVDYYVSMGEYAYASLGRRDAEALGSVFSELARKFVAFVDVLSDVSEHTSLAPRSDLLKTYERWVRTGSAREEQRLLDQGIVPAAGSRRIQ